MLLPLSKYSYYLILLSIRESTGFLLPPLVQTSENIPSFYGYNPKMDSRKIQKDLQIYTLLTKQL